MEEQIVSRGEAVALRFRVNDIAETLLRIERLLERDDGEEEEDEG
jgi:hypothetical protein